MVPRPLLPHDLPPLDPGRRLSQQVFPPFLVGIVTRGQPGPRVEGGWEDQLSSVLWWRISTGCPPPSLLTPTLVWTPTRAEHPQHLLPIISHSSWQAPLEETSSGEEETILFTGFQSIAMARVSQKEGGRGRGR